MNASSVMNISKRLQDEARKDRAKLVMGAVIFAAVLLAIVITIYIVVENRLQALGILVPSVIALVWLSLLLVTHLIKKMEHDSFGEGMHLVMESAPMVCTLYDKSSKVIYCNDEAPKLYGFKDKQEYHDKIFSLFPESQPDGSNTDSMWNKYMQKTFQNGETSFEMWLNMPSGGMFPIGVTLVNAYFEGEDHLLEFTHDKRETYEIQKKEKLFKERTQAIMDVSPMVCVIFDKGGHPIEVNKEAERMFGISDRKLFVDRFFDFQPERQPDGTPTRKKLEELAKKVMNSGGSRHEWMYQLRDGTPVPSEEFMRLINIDGEDLIVGYIRDLREFYKNRERDIQIQQNIQVMAGQLNGHVTEQSTAVTESAAAIEEMIANIQSVTNVLSKNTDRVKELQAASEVGHTGLNDVVIDIREIANESDSLLEINSVMENIASQTNLLSMNAAIEAAHAGEAGRGFAVVADEIRKLSESSSEQSKTIGAVLKKIKGAIDKITRSTDNVLDKFSAIDDGITTVAEQERGVLNAMEEQREGSKQVLEAVGQLSDITYRVKEDAQQMVKRQEEAMEKK
ncbi:MAG: methyl-accepting chemotaxis protein [Treponema sp.]|nr:methyl-accepting chemotaxis protein [Treponema sp.]